MTTDIKIIIKADAKEKCLKRYFTGIPCLAGHISERLVSNGGCIMCAYNRLNKARNKTYNPVKAHKKYKKNRVSEINHAKKRYLKNKKDISLKKLATNNLSLDNSIDNNTYNQKWTKIEKYRLAEMKMKKIPTKEIATLLNRTYYSVVNMIKHLRDEGYIIKGNVSVE